jgi:uncharacterized protein YbjT (DUF2867 family)
MSEKKIIAVVGATGAQGGGLVRAIAADASGPFAARAVTRNPGSDKARALAALGVDVVAGDADQPATLERAFAGAYGAYCVTNFWEHFSADREGEQARAMALASRHAGLQHVIWSTLEDTRKFIPLDDPRMPVLQGKFNVPHFDSKGQMDYVFERDGAPTSFLHVAFYWDNFIYFGMGPRVGDDGQLVLAMPLGGARLPGIAVADVGKCAYGVFQRGAAAVGQRFGIAGEILSGPDMAAKMGQALGRSTAFEDVPFHAYRQLGFPGAEDVGNMFEVQAILGDEFLQARTPALSRELNPDLQSFDAWLAEHASMIPVAG